MKTTRILALPAIAAASLLALTGCFQLPPPGGDGDTSPEPGNSGATQEPGNGGATAGADLAGTTWSGSIGDGFANFQILLNEDGTVDFLDWNDGESSFDSPGDVWSGDASNLTMTVTDLQDQNAGGEPFDVTFTGTAENGQMDLTGQAPDGEWSLTATQE